jgi:signal transduction histidine kinase
VTSPLDAVPGGTFSLSADLLIVAANQGLGMLVDRGPAELVGAPFDELLSAPSRILFQTHVYPALKADGHVEEVFLTVTRRTGEPVPVLLNASASSTDEAAYDGLLVRVRARSRWEADLLAATRALERERTESRRLAQELETRHVDEQRTREFRDAFIGVLSHELRTPITTIYGMSQVLRRRYRTMGPELVGQHLADIDEEADRLRRLTEDLLVLSRAEGGRLELETQPTMVERVVRAAVDGERPRWPDHEFVVEAGPTLPVVLAEDTYVEQIVRNYVGNAAKYSPAGSVVIVTLREEDGGVAVRVIDNGPGLRDSDADRLFDLFYRAPHVVRQTAGAGIGLFVCRELVHGMGGRVWAAAARPPATGAEFGFWLPEVGEDATDS